MLYDLMKKAFFLNRERKEFLYDNFDEILYNIRESKKNKKNKKNKKVIEDTKNKPENDWYVPRDYDHLKHETDNYQPSGIVGGCSSLKKEASKLYDPETPEQMLKVVDLLEKFIDLDNDLTFDNICVFLHPMSIGSQKLVLRPYKLVGLSRNLERLSKEFKKNKNNERNKRLLDELCFTFKNDLKEFRKRLKSPLKRPKKIRIANIGESMDEKNLKESLTNLKQMGHTRQSVVPLLEAIAGDLIFDKETIRLLVEEIFKG